MIKVQKNACETCVYRSDVALDETVLEDSIADGYGGFNGFRVCHSATEACCRGFWNKNKDKFALGQIAQRLDGVSFVEDLTPSDPEIARSVKDLKTQ